MLSILALVLCVVVVVTAVMADRSARAHHSLRAVGLNLCGIGCLALGIAVIFAWGHSHSDVSRRVAFAGSPDGARTTVVQLLINHDGRLDSAPRILADTIEDASGSPSGQDTGAATEIAKIPDNSEGAGTNLLEAPEGAQPSADDEADLAELELRDLQEDSDTNLEEDTPLEMQSRVEIDFDARPEWVDQPDREVGPIHQKSIVVGPYLKLRKAAMELNQRLKEVTDEYINDVVASPHAARWIGYDENEVRNRWVSAENVFNEKIFSHSLDTEMFQSHALLEFGPDFHREVDAAWREVVARARLVKLTIAAGAVLGMLTLLFGYFNADTATRGFYSGRLKFVTSVAILGLVAAGFVIARSIPWLWL